MKYYAIQEKATGRFVARTDFSRADGKPRQIFATEYCPPLLLNEINLHTELLRRRIDPKRYSVVIVEIRTVAER